MWFRDRRQAGEELALRLRYLRGHRAVVLGLSAGGLVVAREIAEVLDAPLDVLLTRRIELFGPPTTILGAAGEGGVLVSNRAAVRKFGIRPDELSSLAGTARADLARQLACYRTALRPVPVAGHSVILVDDGVTTGATARAAIRVARARRVSKVVLAVPVGPARTLDGLTREVDQFVCLRSLRWMQAVRNSYADFTTVTDTDAIALLGREPAPPGGR